MPDVLIRDVPNDDLVRLDARAAKLGLSRTQYIRRRLAQDARGGSLDVAVDDLKRFSATHPDLADDEVMSRAWS